MSQMLIPNTVTEACQMLSSGNRVACAGATNLYVDREKGKYLDRDIVSLHRLKELSGIREEKDGWHIGSLTTFDLIEDVFRGQGSMDALAISIINVAVYMEKEAGRITALTIAIGSAGPTALRAFHTEELLRTWKRPDSEEKWQSLHEEIAIALSEDISPIDDIRATGSYRKTVADNLVLQLVRELWEACEK